VATERTLALARVASLTGEAARAPGLLGTATAWHLGGGGGAWRTRLALECADALGVARADAASLAAACELVHQASIVHDDAQDDAASRRGRASVAARFGLPAAICVGDHLLAASFAVLAERPATCGLIRLFAARVAEMAAGQAEEFAPSLWEGMTPDRYHALARGKAGAAVALPIEGASLLAGLSAPDVAAAGGVGHALGVSYQVGDDAADLCADLARGAPNGVVAHALHAAPPAERAALLALLARARRDGLAPGEAGAEARRLAPHAPRAARWARALLDSSLAELGVAGTGDGGTGDGGAAGQGAHRLAPVLFPAAAALALRLHEPAQPHAA